MRFEDTLDESLQITHRRHFRPLHSLHAAGGGCDNWRLSVDYYDEGELIWLDVDTTIRKLTNGKKSLNDFVANS